MATGLHAVLHGRAIKKLGLCAMYTRSSVGAILACARRSQFGFGNASLKWTSSHAAESRPPLQRSSGQSIQSTGRHTAQSVCVDLIAGLRALVVLENRASIDAVHRSTHGQPTCSCGVGSKRSDQDHLMGWRKLEHGSVVVYRNIYY